jgi:hypothetical protein
MELNTLTVRAKENEAEFIKRTDTGREDEWLDAKSEIVLLQTIVYSRFQKYH